MKIRMYALVAVSAALIPFTSSLAEESMQKSGDSMEGHSDEMAMKGPKFEEMDANQDGEISSDELNVYGNTAAGDSAAERRMRQIEKHDMNDDGKISRDEFDEAVRKAQ
ncbi:hypothetical protein RE428_15110 [Marinobacter nanhaiticus D15-8W]|nr:hypothetical protein [Marinobacter nanhaiticus]BES70493.1 hypothetical protein RE428_15110 [Marinobacter nanhaiticus D15-8W]